MNKISKAAAALGRKGGSVKSERKAKSSAENGKKGGRPALWQNWIVGDQAENCIPIGKQTAADHGLNPDQVVRARSAQEASDKGDKIYNKKIR